MSDRLSRCLPDDLSAVVTHLEAVYPQEGCGAIFRHNSDHRVCPMRNAYDECRRENPRAFPHTARTAYCFDGREWLLEARRAAEQGEELVCVFHSHCDAGAYLSNDDWAMAAPEGELLYPGVGYLVISVYGGKAREGRLFYWDRGGVEDVEVPLRR